MNNFAVEIRKGVEKREKQYETFLNDVVPVKKFQEFAISAILGDPKLKNCTPESIFLAILDAAKAGIIPDGKRAVIIAYGREAQFCPMVRGVIDLIYRGGNVRKIITNVVYEGDIFEYSVENTKANLKHIPKLDTERTTNKAIAVYCIIDLKEQGEQVIEVMDKKEIMACRHAAKTKTVWDSGFFPEMAKKSVIRRAAKRLDWTPNIERVVDSIDKEFDFSGESINAKFKEVKNEGPLDDGAQKLLDDIGFDEKSWGE